MQAILSALRRHLDGAPARAPEGSAIIWNAFDALSRTRSWHAHGPNPITYAEIEAYCRLTRLPLEPRHIAIIRQMDQIWVSAVQAEVRPGAEAKAPPQRLTAAIFDAVFG